MHNVVWGCAEILPTEAMPQCELFLVSGRPGSHAHINFQNGRRSIKISNLVLVLTCLQCSIATNLDMTQSGGELDFVGSNSKSVGANTV